MHGVFFVCLAISINVLSSAKTNQLSRVDGDHGLYFKKYEGEPLNVGKYEGHNNVKNVASETERVKRTCPDGVVCKDVYTCCKLKSGSYGCCPMTNAVCCTDGLHCCKHGYTCHPDRTCLKPKTGLPWLVQEPAYEVKADSSVNA